MLTMKKTVLAVILAGAGVSGMAHAGTVGTAAPSSVELKFIAPAGVTHTMTPTAGSFSSVLPYNTTLASGVITTTDGQAHSVAARITNGEARTYDGLNYFRTISGTGDSANKLVVYLNGETTAGDVHETIDGNDHNVWKGTDEAVSTTYRIMSWPDDQNVNADVYRVETAAYIYTD